VRARVCGYGGTGDGGEGEPQWKVLRAGRPDCWPPPLLAQPPPPVDGARARRE